MHIFILYLIIQIVSRKLLENAIKEEGEDPYGKLVFTSKKKPR
jgi:hypothetical protein